MRERSIPINTKSTLVIWDKSDMMDLVGIELDNCVVLSPNPELHTATEAQCIEAVMRDPKCEKWLPEDMKTHELALAAKLT